MVKRLSPDSKDAYENAFQENNAGNYTLRLFVVGNTAISANAIVNLHRLREQELPGRYRLEIIDILQQPALARGEQIVTNGIN